MNYATEFGLSSDTTDKLLRVIRDLDTEFLRAAHAPRSGKEKFEEISVTDVEGTKQMFSRIASRANSGKKKPHGKP
jgi:hypothetical protein